MEAQRAYGVTRGGATSTSSADRFREEIAVLGYSTLESVLSADEVAELNQASDQAYARQCQEVGGEAVLHSINDADIVRCALAYDEAFLRLATHPVIVESAKQILGEHVVLLMQNAVVNRPDRLQFQTRWHRDLNYQHWTSSRPIALSALVCLEDFNETTGGTLLLPCSHRHELFPSEALVGRSCVSPVLPKGSILLFDSMVFHRAGVNRSRVVRRAVNHVIGAPILAQQIDMAAALGKSAPLDPWLAGYLGYRWNPAGDVAAWRRRKLDPAGQSSPVVCPSTLEVSA